MTAVEAIDAARPGASDAATHAVGSGLHVPTAVVGTGLCVPDRVVTNDEVVQGLDTTSDWVEQRIGVHERRRLAPGAVTSDMCVAAGQEALTRAGVTAGEVDVIIVATFTYDQPLPSTALIVAEMLGATDAWPLDLNQAACAGGVYGLLLASNLLQGDNVDTVLVIGAECLSRVTDPRDRTTAVIFGDAAGAAVVRRSDPGYGLLSFDVGSHLSYDVEIRGGGSARPTDHEGVERGDQYLRMVGRTVWDVATTVLPESLRRAARRAGTTPAGIDHYVLHQANANIVDEVMLELGVDRRRALTTIARLGNTGAATVFTVLHQLVTENRLRRDDVVAVSAIGAGFLWGTLCYRHA